MNDTTILQKKAYKILSIVMGKVHPSFLLNLFALMQEFKNTSQHAKSTRLLCIETLFEKINFNEQAVEDILVMVQEFLPEILLSMKETNHKTRKTATDLIDSLVKKFTDKGMVEDFISLV